MSNALNWTELMGLHGFVSNLPDRVVLAGVVWFWQVSPWPETGTSFDEHVRAL
jgi:hypothetical protein